MIAVRILLWVLAALAALLLLLLAVPVFVRIRYDGELRVRVTMLGIPIRLLPQKEKPEKTEKPAKKPKKKAADGQDKRKEEKTGGLGAELSRRFREDGAAATLETLRRLAAVAVRAADGVLRAIAVDRLWLFLHITAGEAADTAVRYGQACAGVYPALAVLQERLHVRGQLIRIEPDFLGEHSRAAFDVRLRVAVWRAVFVLIRDGIAAFRIVTEETTDTDAGASPAQG